MVIDDGWWEYKSNKDSKKWNLHDIVYVEDDRTYLLGSSSPFQVSTLKEHGKFIRKIFLTT